jgi:AAA domain
MASFQKPLPLKAALKMAFYGPAGSGKTFTALLVSEGLARHTGKRIAFCDTEYGTAFYGQEVAQRAVHPQAFDFDVLYTKSITEVLDAVRKLDPATHGVLVIDSISHLWDACRNAFKGKLTKAGTIPLHAWTTIKKPYKELMHLLLSSPVHVLICGRQGNDFAEDDESGEMKNLGYKMRAEGETAYEPDVLVRLEAHKASKKALAIPVAHIEKDRTGVLAGQSIPSPTFDSLARPLLGLLGTTQASLPSEDEVGVQDAEALARQEWEQTRRSAEAATEYTGRFALAESVAELHCIGGELKPAVKARLTAKDLERVRRAYATRLAALQAPVSAPAAEPGRNGA